MTEDSMHRTLNAALARNSGPSAEDVEHALVWEFDRDSTTCRAICNAAVDADCRLVCNGECETWGEINRLVDETFEGETIHRITHDDCDAGMRPGECNVCLYLNESGCIEELALGGYPNGPRFTIATVPIRPSWEGDGYEWEPLASDWLAAHTAAAEARGAERAVVDGWADGWDVRPLIDRRLADARAEGARAVLDDLEPLFDKVSAMRPENYRLGQDHLPPAFREIDFHAAFMALGEAYNEIEAAARAAAARVEGGA